MLRKHGHGEPWKHKYRVKEVRRHAVLLEVPKDGSVPAISEWQLIRRCEPAPPDGHGPREDDPRLTELGVPVPGSGGEQLDPGEYYEIERILRAVKLGGKYKLLVKWKGHADATWEPRAHILNETNNPELLKEIEDAVQRYREEVHAPENDDDDADTAPHEGVPTPALTGRFPRVHRPPMYYSPSVKLLLETPMDENDYDDSAMNEVLFSIGELFDAIVADSDSVSQLGIGGGDVVFQP